VYSRSSARVTTPTVLGEYQPCKRNEEGERRLNEAGVNPFRGKKGWQPSSVAKLLSSRTTEPAGSLDREVRHK